MGDDCAARPGASRKPTCVGYVGSGEERESLSPQLDFLVFRSGATLFGSPRAADVPVFFEGLLGGLARQGSAYTVP
jgi:hypothetical protein